VSFLQEGEECRWREKGLVKRIMGSNRGMKKKEWTLHSRKGNGQRAMHKEKGGKGEKKEKN